MANGFFDNFLNRRNGNGAHAIPDFDTDLIKVIGIDHTDVTPNLATNQDLADLTAPGRVGTATLGTKTVGTVAAGVCDAADSVMSAVTGDQFESLVLYFDSTVESTSPLIARWDTATGLPFTPSGGDITIVWNASGIYK